MKGNSMSRAACDAGIPAKDSHDESANAHQLDPKGKFMTIVIVGIDLAKVVFVLHGVNEAEVVQLRQPKVARGKLSSSPN